MKVKIIDHTFSVGKVGDFSKVNWGSEFVFIGKTDEESSLVCLTEDVPPNVIEQEDNWQAFRIQGQLDFSLVGILSRITGLLAENHIGIFAISTYNTDYILVKKENYNMAIHSLANAGYSIV